MSIGGIGYRQAMIYRLVARLVETTLRLCVLSKGQAALRERLALGRAPVADIWIHGASVGELMSARSIIEALAKDRTVLVTANSVTGRDMAAGWGFQAQFAPLDVPGAVNRFLDQVRPRLQVTVEGEVWPLRAKALSDRGIPRAIIGARMSRRSAARWARLPCMIGPVLQGLAAVSAQDERSEARLRQLGLPARAVLPRLDLKLLIPAAIALPAPSQARDRVFLAASTHEGEEAVIVDAWLAARKHYPELRLILAIRHPRRGDEVAVILKQRSIPFIRRSNDPHGVVANHQVVLADTVGEMDRWYAMAGLCLVGGSLTDKGGHTPWEPAAYGAAILHGSHVANFTDAYDDLDGAGAALPVNAADLAGHLTRLAGDPAVARRMGLAARRVLDGRAGDPDALIAHLRQLARRGCRPDITSEGKKGSTDDPI